MLKKNTNKTLERSTIMQAMYSTMRSNSDLRNSSYSRGVYQVNNLKKRKDRRTKCTFIFCADIRHTQKQNFKHRATESQKQAVSRKIFITYSSIRESKSLKTSLGRNLRWLLAKELEKKVRA